MFYPVVHLLLKCICGEVKKPKPASYSEPLSDVSHSFTTFFPPTQFHAKISILCDTPFMGVNLYMWNQFAAS